MKAIEFQGKIENGMIKIPIKYNGYNNTAIRVILLIEQENFSLKEKKEKLSRTLSKMKNLKMFSTIYKSNRLAKNNKR